LAKFGKVWGHTTPIESNEFMSFHRIEMKAGSYCSKHGHSHRWNGFFVESGVLEIEVWKNDYALVDVTRLGPREYTKVGPTEIHRMKCVEDCVCFETYWPASLSDDDIFRENVGGTGTDTK
jgi:mannose-6-phosphate isomerase-like protein (cupin superfamily)